jgi:hypothetical protein
MSSALLTIAIVGAGLFSLALGLVHLRIPAILRYADVIGSDSEGPPVGQLCIGRFRFRYVLRRGDMVGMAWVMSNAASYVLLTIGLVDILWSTGWRGVPIASGALWVSGWWAIRAGGQIVVGRRLGDLAIVAWFACLALLHLVVALDGR